MTDVLGVHFLSGHSDVSCLKSVALVNSTATCTLYGITVLHDDLHATLLHLGCRYVQNTRVDRW